jgi:hypothetical protein
MTKNIVKMIFVLKGRIGGFFGGCGFSKLLISQLCAKTGEQKVIKNKLSFRKRPKRLLYPEFTK